MDGQAESLFEHIRIISDPRTEKNKRHPLETIIFIAICGVICGAEGWVDLQRFGELKKEWVSKYVDLSHGIPSHDTFGRFFALLDPKGFREGAIVTVDAMGTQKEIVREIVEKGGDYVVALAQLPQL